MDRDQAHLLIGCAALDSPLPTYDHAQHRVPMKTIVFDLGAKRFSREIDEVGAAQSIGIDERRGRWYVAAPGMTDTGYPDGNVTPVLGIVDAKRGRWLENVPMPSPRTPSPSIARPGVFSCRSDNRRHRMAAFWC